MIPSWWQFALLVLAAFRVFRLLAEDTILDGPRARLLGAPGWHPHDGDPPPGYRHEFAIFLTCPWCAGFWLSLAAWGCWSWQPHWTLVACAPLAISAIVGLVSKNLDE